MFDDEYDDDDDRFDPMSEGVSGRRNYYDDDADLRRQQQQKDRKKARKHKKEDAKQKRIAMHQQWIEQKKQNRLKQEEEKRQKKKIEQKAKYDKQKKAALPPPPEPVGKKKKGKKQQQQEEAPPSPVSTGRKRTRVDDASEAAPSVSKKAANVEASAPPTTAPAAKYVVPAKREQAKGNAAAQSEVRSLLNRLSLTNVMGIARAISDLFVMGRFPRLDVMKSVCDELAKNCFRNVHLTSNSAIAYAGVIRALQVEHGNDAIITVFQHTCQQLDDAIMTAENDGKVAVNAGMFVSYLYLLFACDAGLPLSLLQSLLTTTVGEEAPDAGVPVGVEVTLGVLRSCGFEMRQKVPQALNSIVDLVQTDQKVARHRVLLDLIKDIAKGKKSTLTQHTDFSIAPETINSVLSQLGEVVKRTNTTLPTRAIRKAVESINVLAVSFEGCLEQNPPPRWYNERYDFYASQQKAKAATSTGGSKKKKTLWEMAGEEGDIYGDEEEFLGEEEEYEGEAEEGEDEDEEENERETRKAEIEQLRTKEKALSGQRFSSEAKRAIFNCIVSASDEQECFHMLIRRDPSCAQLADTAFVLIQCAIQEKLYNNFYAEVLHRFISSAKKHKTTIQFALWDRWKVFRIQPVDMTSYVNMASMLSYFFEHDLFALSMLRGLDLQVDSRNIILFTRILFLRMLLEMKSERLAAFFFGGDISRGELSDVNISTVTLRKTLKKFFQQYFLAEDEAGRWIPPLFDVVAYGLGEEVDSVGALNETALLSQVGQKAKQPIDSAKEGQPQRLLVDVEDKWEDPVKTSAILEHVLFAAAVGIGLLCYYIPVYYLPRREQDLYTPDFNSMIPIAFPLLIAVEWLVLSLGAVPTSTGAKFQFADCWGSVASFTVQGIAIVLLKRFVPMTSLYIYLYDNFRLVDLPETVPVCILATIGCDWCFYWFHRHTHVYNFLWPGHAYHHNGEYYNMMTGLRGTWWMGFVSDFWYLPLAICIPPRLWVPGLAWVMILQFWVHTCSIRKMWWPLEYIFVTPSHHRLHHDRRLHKNYGGTLIIWDRLFGTFQEETEHCKVPLRLDSRRHVQSARRSG